MRILALDVGERRIGVAVSDPLQVVARSLQVITRTSLARDLATLAELVRDLEVETVVVGHPRTLSGEAGQQAQLVEAFVEELRRVIEVPITLWDERLSTVSAARLLRERGLNARAQRDRIDATSAAVFLQSYLDSQAFKRDENQA
jgi:putative Holliday junction resolvase